MESFKISFYLAERTFKHYVNMDEKDKMKRTETRTDRLCAYMTLTWGTCAPEVLISEMEQDSQICWILKTMNTMTAMATIQWGMGGMVAGATDGVPL